MSKSDYSIKKYFLINFFKLINEQNIDYCVIHGYEALPLNYFGHDLDILINYSDLSRIKSIVYKLINKYKLNIFRIEERQQLFEFVLYDDKLETIILQFIFLLDYRGVPIFNNPEVFSRTRRFNNITIPSKFHEYVYSFFVRYFWGKEIHKKYFSNFKKIYNSPDVKKVLKTIFLRKQFALFDKAIRYNDDIKLIYIRKKMILSFFIKGFFREPVLFLKGVFRRYYFGIVNAFKHKGKFIVLVGPDGVGKTTLAYIITDLLKDYYRGIKYFHFIPKKLIDARKLDTITQKNKISFDDISNPKIISLLRIFRNTIRFNLNYFKIIYYIYKQNLIIGDRYFYNYFFYPSSMKYSASKEIVNFFYKLIPKPKFIFFIEASPEIIHNRKKELTKDEILKQLNLIKNFVKKNNNTYIINNDNNPHDAASTIAKIILRG